MSAKKKKSKAKNRESLVSVASTVDRLGYHYSITESRTGSRPQPLRVYMNIEDMKRQQLTAGDFVMLEANGLKALSYVWPSNVVLESCLQISGITSRNLRLDADSDIILNAYPDVPGDATVVYLIPPKNAPTGGDFVIYLKEVLVDLEYCINGQIFECQDQGEILDYTIHLDDSVGPLQRITRKTEIRIKSTDNQAVKGISYGDIGGLDGPIKEIRNLVDMALNHPEKFTKYGLSPPKGFICYGPPGTGKTLIARAVAAETNAHVIVINGPEIISQFYGETEAKLSAAFAEAIQNQPSIIFMDELDSLCPKREDSQTELEKRIVTCLLSLMDGANDKNKLAKIMVMGATNRIDSIDAALRRPGRFDREFEIGIPNATARIDILQKLCKSLKHNLKTDDFVEVASLAHGYVGADLAAVCREAGLNILKRLSNQAQNAEENALEKEDLIIGLSKVRPSVVREIVLEVPKVYWTDIGGQNSIKQRLKEAVEWPLKHPERFAKFNIRPPKGLLLYGPPGCSKTLMAKALATEAGLNFLAVKGPELFSKWVGESEKAVQKIFQKARAASPSVIFFDEIDALAVRRSGSESSVADRVLSQLLLEMDGVEPLVNVTIIAATNRPDILDSALLRPGRIDSILYVSPPDLESRESIFKIKLKKMPIEPGIEPIELAELTDGFSGAETVAVCQKAALLALEESNDCQFVNKQHFLKAISATTKRITPEMLQFYHDFEKRSGLHAI